jgi:LCP family protein required for cell wall assembly
VLIGGVGGWFYVNSVLSSIKRFQVQTVTQETSGAPIDILLVGSDSRAFVAGPGQVSAFGNAATQTGQRSDVIIVVRLVPDTRQIEMLSIPRDTYVPIPGSGGSNRINAAFNTGPSLLVQTIQQNFGIPINHVVVANFQGFEGMVNALGGISLDFPYPVRDHGGMPERERDDRLGAGSQQASLLLQGRELELRRHERLEQDPAPTSVLPCLDQQGKRRVPQRSGD